MSKEKNIHLLKVLGAKEVWAIGVGLVISGEYFGWNYGWDAAGTVGFLIATIVVTIMYTAFVFSFTELSSSIPDAGGPFAYASKALGNYGGLIAGYATLVEFVLAPPAIAFALGSYIKFLYPPADIRTVAIGAFILFTLVNMLGIKESARFNLVITLLAIGELLVFLAVVGPHFKAANFLQDPMPSGRMGIFAALPFAIWFFLGIEGLAMTAEEVKDPKKNIPKGYLWALFTLVVLALGIMIVSGGIGNWKDLARIDYPLPESVAMALGKDNHWTGLFTSIGLLGLVASFHSLIIGSSRQIFALARSGFLPASLSRVNKKHHTPHWALIAGTSVGIIALLIGKTDKIIILSALGAVTMYGISMVSLFKLRRSDSFKPAFKTPLYPWLPILALTLSVVCLIAIIYYNQMLSLLFFGILILLVLLYRFMPNDLRPKRPSNDILS